MLFILLLVEECLSKGTFWEIMLRYIPIALYLQRPCGAHSDVLLAYLIVEQAHVFPQECSRSISL